MTLFHKQIETNHVAFEWHHALDSTLASLSGGTAKHNSYELLEAVWTLSAFLNSIAA